MSRKTGDFLSLLRYINKAEQQSNTAILHNLKSDDDDLLLIAEEFQENATYVPKRKNGVICYHEIISLPAHTTYPPELWEEIARKYLWLRAPDAIGYAKLHNDTAHPHIHFCISGNHLKQHTKNRLSRQEFQQVKQKIRIYFREKYPHLSLPKLSPKTSFHQQNLSPKAHEKQPIKATLSQKILDVFSQSKNLKEALFLLEKDHIVVYQRGKNLCYGVIFQGKKYRLSTLGIQPVIKEKQATWSKIEKRMLSLKAITLSKEKAPKIYRVRD